MLSTARVSKSKKPGNPGNPKKPLAKSSTAEAEVTSQAAATSEEKKPEPVTKRASKPLGSGIKRGFNIRDAHRPKEEDAAEENRRKLRNEPFTAEAAKTAWNQYLEQLEEANRKVEYNAFMTGKMEMNTNGHLLFKFGSLALLNEFTEHKEDILLFLRDRLQNDYLLLETELDAEEAKKYTKTNQEVFDEMSHKNPLLKKLKEDLGLNLDK